jgi:hypothetical protein
MVRGVAVSVALHLLLIFGYRLTAPKAPPELPPKETMTVWLMQPRPTAPAPVKTEPPAQPIQQPAGKQTETRTKAATRQPAPVATSAEPAATAAENPPPQPIAPATPATPATASASNPPDPLYPPQQQQQQQQQSRQFDMNAALKTARKVANEKDPARAGTAVAQLDDHPLYPEQNANELATKMAAAKRQGCLDANGGGNLLTPLFWLLHKKDHGCKL